MSQYVVHTFKFHHLGGRDREREERKEERREERRGEGRREEGGREGIQLPPPKASVCFLSSFPFPTQLGEQRKAEREREIETGRQTDRQTEREGGGRRRRSRRTTRGVFPPSRAPVSLPPAEDRRPPKPLAWLGPTEPAAQHSDGEVA